MCRRLIRRPVNSERVRRCTTIPWRARDASSQASKCGWFPGSRTGRTIWLPLAMQAITYPFQGSNALIVAAAYAKPGASPALPRTVGGL